MLLEDFEGHELYAPHIFFWLSILMMNWYSTRCEHRLFKFAESACVTGSYYRLSISVVQVLLDLKQSIFVKTRTASNVLAMEPQTQETKLPSFSLKYYPQSSFAHTSESDWKACLQISKLSLLVLYADTEYLLLYLGCG